jgi:hypothetical protein
MTMRRPTESANSSGLLTPMTDPVARERAARDQMAALKQRSAYWANERRLALLDLHAELGTWQKVADATGQKLPTVHKAAKQPQRGTTP